jgi:hypothetical protein
MFDVKEQSKAAYLQHKEVWLKNCRENGKLDQGDMSELRNIGVGRALLICATGYSLEQNIETIKKHWEKIDIMCCDKALGHLLDNGITPRFVVVQDARISYDKYLKPWENDPRLKEVTACFNVCANPEWAFKVAWKKMYFHANKDAMGYEKEFMKEANCKNLIIAGTNVSNAMLIFATQCEGNDRRNFMGYDKYVLVGFDYCWTYEGNYYAFSKDGGGKANYMRHLYLMDSFGNHVYSSQNLHQSATWANAYITNYNLPVVNCSNQTLLSTGTRYNLEEQMQYKYDPEDSSIVKELDKDLRSLTQRTEIVKNRLRELAEKHYYGYVGTLY